MCALDSVPAMVTYFAVKLFRATQGCLSRFAEFY